MVVILSEYSNWGIEPEFKDPWVFASKSSEFIFLKGQVTNN